MAKSNANRKLKIVPPVEEPQAQEPEVETKQEAKPEERAKAQEPIKEEAKAKAKASKRAEKSQWKTDLKLAVFRNPKLNTDEIAALVIKNGFPSRASTDYAVNETLHTMRVLKEFGVGNVHSDLL